MKFFFDLERSKTGRLLFFISNGLAPKKITDSIVVRYNLLNSRTRRTLSILDENMSMFAGQNGGPYSGSVTNPMMNPMMNNYSQNISAWMAPKQYGILATGVGSARDNILPGNVTKINRGKSSTRNRPSRGPWIPGYSKIKMYSDEHKQLLRAKRYAMEVSLKFAMRKQAEKKQKMQGTVLTRTWTC